MITILEFINMTYTMFHRFMVLGPSLISNFNNHTMLHIIQSINYSYLHYMRHTISKSVDFITLLVTFDRFFAIYYPTKWRAINSGLTALILNFGSVAIAIAIDVPEYMGNFRING